MGMGLMFWEIVSWTVPVTAKIPLDGRGLLDRDQAYELVATKTLLVAFEYYRYAEEQMHVVDQPSCGKTDQAQHQAYYSGG